jgi:Protein of unknown function (DUF3300)
MRSWMAVLPVAFLCCSHASAAPEAPPAVQGETVVPQSPQQLEQLVAPIALYPDALVAQILAASTYPTEIVEADRWVQQHSDLKGQQLAQAVDQQSWDPSVKAITQFPSVLANMDKNLSWASALGDAYVNDQQAVLDAVQTMRKRAQQAGNLKTTPQEKVVAQGQTIVIEPASPDVVYVPAYDPWLVYGPPLVAYPGWYWYPGLYAVGPGISFGIGFGLGFYAGFGWGWHHWDADWRGRRVMFDHDRYVSRSRTFIDHNHFYRGGPGFHGGREFHGRPEFHGGPDGHGGPGFHGGAEGHGGPAFHGSATPQAHPGTRSGAFSGFDHGGVARGFSSRGQSSLGGGFHGGGFHGGGFHGGGGHR